MKKLLSWFGTFFCVLLLCLIGLIFTPIGNSISTPFAQTLLNLYAPFPLQIQELRIRFGKLSAKFRAQESLEIMINGTYSLGSFHLTAHAIDRTHDLNLTLQAFGTYNDYKLIARPTQSTQNIQYSHNAKSTQNLQNPKSTPKSSQNLQPINLLYLNAKGKFFKLESFECMGKNIALEYVLGFFGLQSDRRENVAFYIKKSDDRYIARAQILGFSLYDLVLHIDAKWELSQNTLTHTIALRSQNATYFIRATSNITTSNAPTKAIMYDASQTPLVELDIPQISTDTHQGIFQLKILKPFSPNPKTKPNTAYNINDGTHNDNLKFSGDFAYKAPQKATQSYQASALSLQQALLLNAQTDSFGGILALSLNHGIVKFKGENISLQKILLMMRTPDVLDALLRIDGTYNLEFYKGWLNLNSQQVSILGDDVLGLGDFALQAESKISGLRLDSRLWLTNPTKTLQATKCMIDFSRQTLEIEFAEPFMRLKGNFWNIWLDMRDPRADESF